MIETRHQERFSLNVSIGIGTDITIRSSTRKIVVLGNMWSFETTVKTSGLKSRTFSKIFFRQLIKLLCCLFT